MTKSAFRAATATRRSRWCATFLSLAVLIAGQPAAAAERGLGFAVSLVLLAAIPFVAVAALTWPLQIVHRRIRSLELNTGWTGLICVWAISLLGLLYATKAAKKGEWFAALADRFPFALTIMALAFGLFLIFANISATQSTTSAARGAWWAARLSALHVTLLLFPTIMVGLAMPPFGMVFLPLILMIGTHAAAISELLQVVHQILSLGLPRELHPVLHWLDAGIFCAALYYLATYRDDGDVPGTTQAMTRRVPGGGFAAPRADFGRRVR